MAIIMENQFQKLEEFVLNQVDKFFFFAGIMAYLGPVNPSSIISFRSGLVHFNALVLAEGVPAYYLPSQYTSMLFEAVIVHLDENFEFKQYDPKIKALFQLNLLIGDPNYSYNGTVDEAKEFYAKNNSTIEVLYRKESTNS